MQVDFGELGIMFDPESGRRRKVWALVFTAAYYRRCYVRLSFSQTLEVVVAGFEAAWLFFAGVFKIVIPDNMKTFVPTADGCVNGPANDHDLRPPTRELRSTCRIVVVAFVAG